MMRVDCLFEEILLVHSLRTIAHLHMDTLHTCYTARLHDDVAPVYIKTRVLIPVCCGHWSVGGEAALFLYHGTVLVRARHKGHVLMVLLLLLSQQQSQKDSLYCQCSRPPSENHCTADC